MAENIIDLRIDTTGMKVGIKSAALLLNGLSKVVDEVGAAITDAFSIGGYKDYLKTVRRFGKGLTDELLVMQLSFGTMKAAIADACAPLAAVFVPMINDAIAAVTRFAGFVGEFFRGMVIGITGRDALAESAEKAASAEDKLASSSKKSGAAVRRSLMAFDQINRLNGGSGGGSSAASAITWPDTALRPISDRMQAVVDRVMAILRPLLDIDFTPLILALRSLWAQVTELAATVGAALENLWFEALAPFTVWLAESLAPAMTEFFAGGLTAVNAAIKPLLSGIGALWEGLKPVVSYIGTAVLEVIECWEEAFVGLAAVFTEKNPQITGIFQNIATVLKRVWNTMGPVLSDMTWRFAVTFDEIAAYAAEGLGHLVDALYAITAAVAGAFTGNWKAAWNGVKDVVKSAVNGIITILNAMLTGIGNGLNSIVRAANSLSFTLPEWIPGLGGKSFKPGISYVTVPKIPKLAQGAVLPANHPFLAVVGDQRHGTNIEAPLSLIQTAMADVMADSLAGNMAGFNATVEVLQKILQAVLGISVGDEVIGAAAARYNRRMAMMKGV